MSDRTTYVATIVAVYCYQLTRYCGLSSQDYDAIFQDGPPTLEVLERECMELAKSAIDDAEHADFKVYDDKDDTDSDAQQAGEINEEVKEDGFKRLKSKVEKLKRRITALLGTEISATYVVKKLSRGARNCMKSTGVAGLVVVWKKMLEKHLKEAQTVIVNYFNENSLALTRDVVLKWKKEEEAIDRDKSELYSVVLFLLGCKSFCVCAPIVVVSIMNHIFLTCRLLPFSFHVQVQLEVSSKPPFTRLASPLLHSSTPPPLLPSSPPPLLICTFPPLPPTYRPP